MLNIVFVELDDVFVRRDLYEGKYAPDLEQQRLWELEMNGNLRYDIAGLREGFQADLENIKVEL